jgi:thioesterase domain-containing protein/acyl carrier protein
MLPATFTYLPELPVNRNGKMDLAALRALAIEAAATEAADLGGLPDAVPPRSDVEARMLAIFEEKLGRRGFGVAADYFRDLGGDSLRAVQILAAIEREFDRRVPVAAFVAGPTVEALARVVADGGEEASGAYLVPLRSGGSLPPLFLLPPIQGEPITYLQVARLLPGDQPVYAGHLVGTAGEVAPDASIAAIAAAYVAELRRTFGEGPVRLGGHSSGGLVAFEVARQLEAAGGKVDRVIFFDTPAPAPGAPPAAPRWRVFVGDLARAWLVVNGASHPRIAAALRRLRAPAALPGPAGSTGEAASGPSAAASATELEVRGAATPVSVGRAGPAPTAVPPMTLTELLSRLEELVDDDFGPEGRAAAGRLLREFRRLDPVTRRRRAFELAAEHSALAHLTRPELPAERRRAVARASWVLLQACKHYEASGPVAAPLVYLRAQGRPADPPGSDWGTLTTGGVVTIPVPGGHEESFLSPNLDRGVAALVPLLGA